MKNEDTKLIRVSDEAHEAIRQEAVRQSMKPNTIITMGMVIDQMAKKLKGKSND